MTQTVGVDGDEIDPTSPFRFANAGQIGVGRTTEGLSLSVRNGIFREISGGHASFDFHEYEQRTIQTHQVQFAPSRFPTAGYDGVAHLKQIIGRPIFRRRAFPSEVSYKVHLSVSLSNQVYFPHDPDR